MPKNKFFATGPNGEQFKRESASRTYTHCVIGRRSYDNAERRVNEDRRRHASDWDYFSACAAGTYDFPSFYREESKVKAQQEGQKWIAETGCSSRDSYVQRRHAEELEELQQLLAKGEFDRFYQISWAGREDLAQKAAAAAMTGGYYAETRYVPAERR